MSNGQKEKERTNNGTRHSSRKPYPTDEKGLPIPIQELGLGLGLISPNGETSRKGIILPKSTLLTKELMPQDNLTRSEVKNYIADLQNKIDNHHFFWPRPEYEDPLFRIVRNLAIRSIQACLPRKDIHLALLHRHYGPPMKPDPDQALNIVLWAKEHNIPIRTGPAFKPVLKPIPFDLVDELKAHHKRLERGYDEIESGQINEEVYRRIGRTVLT